MRDWTKFFARLKIIILLFVTIITIVIVMIVNNAVCKDHDLWKVDGDNAGHIFLHSKEIWFHHWLRGGHLMMMMLMRMMITPSVGGRDYDGEEYCKYVEKDNDGNDQNI